MIQSSRYSVQAVTEVVTLHIYFTSEILNNLKSLIISGFLKYRINILL